ncbi:MAG: MBL fold metallo-hydrolase [Vicinamibacteria bacterium]|nr:MBL fold metallo-hydrolase [Vicinamibacteria bacterium]
MLLHQFYLGCLAQASYLIGSEGEAAVVDPRRDVDLYLAFAQERGLRIRHVIETHLHADFVSGHRELALRTGAEIVIGAAAAASFPHRGVRDGDELRLGSVRLRFLETPGHTPEGVCVLVFDPAEAEQPAHVLTGDTLFVGDVGRPDLAGGSGWTAERMAAAMYDTLHGKLLPLPDGVQVWPAHGAGSLCGKNLSKDTSSTIGRERRTNPALQPMDREAFVRMLTADQPEVPRYFPMDVELNRSGAPPLAGRPAPRPLAPATFAEAAAGGAQVVDVRGSLAFGAEHVAGAVNVDLDGQFAAWCGALLDPGRDILLVADDAAGAAQAAMRLARVGLERVEGFLDGGVAAWRAAGMTCASIPQWSVEQLASRDPEWRVLDVRRPGEHEDAHVPGALNVPLDRLERSLQDLDREAPWAVICAGGYRSSSACGLLLRAGFRHVVNVRGGTSAWVAARLPTSRVARAAAG